LIPYRNSLSGDGQDAMPVNVQAVDKMGRVVPTANFNIQFEVTGSIQNIGVANGNPNSHEMEKATNRNLFHGMAQIIVQSTENGKGAATIKAHAVGMKDAEVTIEIK
jgi:beta-galactosidase